LERASASIVPPVLEPIVVEEKPLLVGWFAPLVGEAGGSYLCAEEGEIVDELSSSSGK